MSSNVFQTPNLSDIIVYRSADLTDIELADGYDTQIAQSFEATFARMNRGAAWASQPVVVEPKRHTLVTLIAAIFS